MKRLSILGSTGSIGRSTLDLVATFTDRFSVASLAAGRNLDLLEEQVRRFHPECVSTADQETAREHVPLSQLAAQGASFEVWDSLLSEEAALAFEYGYSLARPGG